MMMDRSSKRRKIKDLVLPKKLNLAGGFVFFYNRLEIVFVDAVTSNLQYREFFFNRRNEIFEHMKLFEHNRDNKFMRVHTTGLG